MRNLDLAHDYAKRARVRLGALVVRYDGESWPDVVRESQEVVELALKALLRASGIDVPRVRDVALILLAERARLPEALAPSIDELRRRLTPAAAGSRARLLRRRGPHEADSER